MVEDDRDSGTATTRGKHVRYDVAISGPFKTQQIRQIPKNLQSLAFEKQIREIDEAITGDAVISEKPLNSDSVQDILADLQNTAQ